MTPARRALIDQIGAFEERAAILECDGGLTRGAAEAQAERELGSLPVWSGSIEKVIVAGEEPITASTTAN